MGDISATNEPDDILSSMQNSVWGGEYSAQLMFWPSSHKFLTDMLVEAAEEEDEL